MKSLIGLVLVAYMGISKPSNMDFVNTGKTISYTSIEAPVATQNGLVLCQISGKERENAYNWLMVQSQSKMNKLQDQTLAKYHAKEVNFFSRTPDHTNINALDEYHRHPGPRYVSYKVSSKKHHNSAKM